jgi:hypothetical protein
VLPFDKLELVSILEKQKCKKIFHKLTIIAVEDQITIRKSLCPNFYLKDSLLLFLFCCSL